MIGTKSYFCPMQRPHCAVARSFVKSQNGLMGVISSKGAALDSMLKAVGNRPGASL